MGIFDDLMSPLGKQHCMYFYFLGYIGLLVAVLTFIIGLTSIYKKNYRILGLAISYFITSILMYYVARLNYSICLGAYK